MLIRLIADLIPLAAQLVWKAGSRFSFQYLQFARKEIGFLLIASRRGLHCGLQFAKKA